MIPYKQNEWKVFLHLVNFSFLFSFPFLFFFILLQIENDKVLCPPEIQMTYFQDSKHVSRLYLLSSRNALWVHLTEFSSLTHQSFSF